MALQARFRISKQLVPRGCALFIVALICTHVSCGAFAQPEWFYLTDRLVFPAGVDVAVALGAALDVKKLERALPNFKVEVEDLEGVSTVSISYINDRNVGVLLYHGAGKVYAIQTFGSAGNSLGIRVGMPIDQVPEALPSKCSLDKLSELYDCTTDSPFHYRVDASKCLLSGMPEKLPAFAECLKIRSIAIGNLRD